MISLNDRKNNDFKIKFPQKIQEQNCYVISDSSDNQLIKVKCLKCPLTTLSINAFSRNPYKSLYVHLRSNTHTRNTSNNLVKKTKFYPTKININKLITKPKRYIFKRELPIGLERYNCFKFDESVSLSSRYHKITCNLCPISSFKIDTLYKNPYANIYKHLKSKMHIENVKNTQERLELNKQVACEIEIESHDQLRLKLDNLNFKIKQAQIENELKLREKEYLEKINDIQQREMQNLKEIFVKSIDFNEANTLNDKLNSLENENKQFKSRKHNVDNEYLKIQNNIHLIEAKKNDIFNENSQNKLKLDRLNSCIQKLANEIEISHNNDNENSFRFELLNKIKILNLENKILRDKCEAIGQNEFKYEQNNEQLIQNNNVDSTEDEIIYTVID
jgi:hypothetical protein